MLVNGMQSLAAHNLECTGGPMAGTMTAVLPKLYIGAMACALLGYVVMGKAFAYIGAAPVYVGEVLLALGAMCLCAMPGLERVFRIPLCMPVLAFMGWGAARTLPFIPIYKTDALRDGATWAYAGFAIIVAMVLIESPPLLAGLLRRFRGFAAVVAVAAPVLWVVQMFASQSLPRCPWAPEMPIIMIKSSDLLVHLAGALAFAMGVGMPWSIFRCALLGGEVLMIGSFARGGLLAFVGTMGLCFAARPVSRWVPGLLALFVAGFACLAVSGVAMEFPGTDRVVSAPQIISNFASLSSDNEEGNLQGTKEFRVLWWATIFNYTVHGEYFWVGKGFGINLADDDGFQLREDGSLRSPHNTHLMLLARSGVPGLALWCIVQIGWAWRMWRFCSQSRRAGQARWAGMFLFLLGYWLAFVINTCFDPFLEGPQGAVWFWTIFGVGLAAMHIYQHCPEALSDEDPGCA